MFANTMNYIIQYNIKALASFFVNDPYDYNPILTDDQS